MEIDLELLRIVADKLFAHLEESGCKSVTIREDYYWSVPKEQRYDPYSEPKQLTLGQLSDDFVELQRIAKDETQPLAYGFVWLSSIIRVIGEKVVS